MRIKALNRTVNSWVQLALGATWRHTSVVGSGPVGAVASRLTPIRYTASGHRGIRVWFVAPVTFLVVAWGIAATTVAINDGFGSGDLAAFALWSVPPAIALGVVVRKFNRVFDRWPSSAVFLASGAIAVIVSFIWIKAVSWVLGPYVMAFSFPVGFCWLAGAAVALALELGRLRPGAVRFVPLGLVAPALLLAGSIGFQAEPPPDLTIEPSSLATSKDRNSLLGSLLHSPPTPDPSTYNPVGVRTVSGAGTNIRVTFHASSNLQLREEYIAKIRSSPLVASVVEVPVRAERRSPYNKAMKSDVE